MTFHEITIVLQWMLVGEIAIANCALAYLSLRYPKYQPVAAVSRLAASEAGQSRPHLAVPLFHPAAPSLPGAAARSTN